MGVAGTQLLNPSPAASQGCTSRKLALETGGAGLEPSTLAWGKGFPSSIFTTLPNANARASLTDMIARALLDLQAL